MKIFKIEATIRVDEDDVRSFLRKEDDEDITDDDYEETAHIMFENEMCEYGGMYEE